MGPATCSFFLRPCITVCTENPVVRLLHLCENPSVGFPIPIRSCFLQEPQHAPLLRYPQGPRLAAPDRYPLGTQASGPGVSSPVSLSVDQSGTPREQPPMPCGMAPPLLPGPGFFSHGARALAALRPPGSRLARSLLARCQVPRSSPRHCARASSLFHLLPLPSRSGSRGTAAGCVSRIPRAAAQPALLELAPPHASALRLPRGSLPALSLLLISPPLLKPLELDWAPLKAHGRLRD